MGRPAINTVLIPSSRQENYPGSLPSFSLETLGIVDAPPEESFDELTKPAQTVFAIPVSSVSIVEVDNHRQYFRSQSGLPEPWAGKRPNFPLTLFC